jgi:hypothetical protein
VGTCRLEILDQAPGTTAGIENMGGTIAPGGKRQEHTPVEGTEVPHLIFHFGQLAVLVKLHGT